MDPDPVSTRVALNSIDLKKSSNIMKKTSNILKN
jgi:hypothetical protein